MIYAAALQCNPLPLSALKEMVVSLTIDGYDEGWLVGRYQAAQQLQGSDQSIDSALAFSKIQGRRCDWKELRSSG